MDTRKPRVAIFLFVAVVHALLIFFMVFQMQTRLHEREAPPEVMKLVDIQEELPPPVVLPPPPVLRPPSPVQNTVEAIAENMVATDEVPEAQVIGETGPVVRVESGAADYLPQHKVSKVPVIPDDQIRKNTVYPPIALRSGIEGTVILELFIDKAGNIRQIRIMKEDPEGRGFGEAAVNAFKGVRVSPAEANGQQVALRYRYPVRFKISG